MPELLVTVNTHLLLSAGKINLSLLNSVAGIVEVGILRLYEFR